MRGRSGTARFAPDRKGNVRQARQGVASRGRAWHGRQGRRVADGPQFVGRFEMRFRKMRFRNRFFDAIGTLIRRVVAAVILAVLWPARWLGRLLRRSPSEPDQDTDESLAKECALRRDLDLTSILNELPPEAKPEEADSWGKSADVSWDADTSWDLTSREQAKGRLFREVCRAPGCDTAPAHRQALCATHAGLDLRQFTRSLLEQSVRGAVNNLPIKVEIGNSAPARPSAVFRLAPDTMVRCGAPRGAVPGRPGNPEFDGGPCRNKATLRCFKCHEPRCSNHTYEATDGNYRCAGDACYGCTERAVGRGLPTGPVKYRTPVIADSHMTTLGGMISRGITG